MNGLGHVYSENTELKDDFLTEIMMAHISSLLILLITANSSPVLMKLFFHKHFDVPLDGNKLFFDGKPIFGHTKTVRGILSSLILTSLMALAIGVPATQGSFVSGYAMTGDLLSSFTKRRFGIPSSKSTPVLDQLPESLLPLLMVKSYFNLAWGDAVIVLASFLIIDLVLSFLLARFYENSGTH